MLNNVLTIILAGGVGERLRPITERRCKPAVHFGGSFRLIDFTLMNCVASDLTRIHVLAQYHAESLVQHCRERWRFLSDDWDGFVETVTPEVSPSGNAVYRGTADAVYKNLKLLELHSPEIVLVLSGDHIYHADYRKLIEAHIDSAADVTALTYRIPMVEATRFGVLEVTPGGRVTRFVEKPEDPRPFAREGSCIINLGVYCFRPQFLRRRLVSTARNPITSYDFGKDVLPDAVEVGTVVSCSLEVVSPRPYWRDVGTVDSFFQASMDVLCSPEGFDLRNPGWPLDAPFHDWVPEQQSVQSVSASNSVRGRNVIASNVRMGNAHVLNCVVSSGVVVGDGARLEECILFPGAAVGRDCKLRRVIVEENARVPPGTDITSQNGVRELLGVSQRGVIVFPGSPLNGVERKRKSPCLND